MFYKKSLEMKQPFQPSSHWRLVKRVVQVPLCFEVWSHEGKCLKWRQKKLPKKDSKGRCFVVVVVVVSVVDVVVDVA